MTRRIVFITGTRIGDAVLSTGALSWLLARHPDARVTIACGPAAAPLFRAVPGLERTIVLAKRPFGAHWLALWRTLATHAWDVAVDLRGSWTTRFVRARERRIWRPGPPQPKAREAAAVLGLTDSPPLTVWLDAAARAAADRIVPAGRPVLALAPGAHWSGKRWPPERFAALARALLGEPALAGAAAFLVAGPDEREAADAVAAGLPGVDTLTAGVGLGLVETAACLARCRLFVGNDSGLMHLAAAAGAPTLGLFGPTDERLYAPFGRFAKTVRGRQSYEELTRAPPRHDEGFARMEGLSVEAALAAARALLTESAPWRPMT